MNAVISVRRHALHAFGRCFFTNVRFVIGRRQDINGMFLRFLAMLMVFVGSIVGFRQFGVVSLHGRLIFDDRIDARLFNGSVTFRRVTRPGSYPHGLIRMN